MIVCGAGVRNHQELVELVEFKLASLGVLELAKGHGAKREKSIYVGGE